MKATCIRIEGGLLSPDLLERIHELQGQKPADFGLDRRRSLVDEVSSVWGDARLYWTAFQRRLGRGHGESLTTVTREQWVIPLLEAFGYKLTYQRRAAVVDGRSYVISHRAGEDEEAPPVHIVGFDQELGSRPPAGRAQLSPHAMLQDYLNRTEHLWGIVTNGRTLRLLRDSSYITRPSYVEFDLEQMLEGERLDEFILFYRLVHRSRLPRGTDDVSQCLLEQYHQDAIEQGGRIRDRLRDAVEEAIRTFANGFLSHAKNEELRQGLRSGSYTPQAFYQDLLYLIYRLLFLMVAEERNLLSVDGAARTAGTTDYYSDYLGITRLRHLADPAAAGGSGSQRFDDLYLGLNTLFHVLRDEELAESLGLPPLNGELFEERGLLEAAHLNNADLLKAVARLSFFSSLEEKVRRRVNYAALDVEELGSVYESLLDFQPHISDERGRLRFEFIKGTERKSTGSYYTRPELVRELVNSALVPVMEERLQQAGTPEEKEEALLRLKVSDPACGSGHFLLAAARRIGQELARVRTGDDQPSPEAVREAVRQVIGHCIYGVDKNPLAVDLCKVALWIEGHSAGKPLTFLDHRIRCGDSLVGVLDLSVLKQGIPDEAFTPVTGDDKTVARALKKRNKLERRAPQIDLVFDSEEELAGFLDTRRLLDRLPDDTPAQVRQKREALQRMQREGGRWWHDTTACHLWTAAFFDPLTREPVESGKVPTTEALRRYMESPNAAYGPLVGRAWQVARRHRFFHWPLEFPEVFEEGGFDVVLCNPPWEILELEEQEFFATRDPEIAAAPNKAARRKLIPKLSESNPALWQEYQAALHDADALRRFLRQSGRFSRTARGRTNSYSVFAELFHSLIRRSGRVGAVLPTGIATDDTNKQFFTEVIARHRLVSLFDLANLENLFPAVDSNSRFCLFTVAGDGNLGAAPEFVFFATRPEHLQDQRRRYTLGLEDFARINPNTRTCPLFRTGPDADLARKIYEGVPVLVNEETGQNPWGIRFMTMFHMANDSHLFRTREQLEGEGFRLVGNRFVKGEEVWLPLYEGKMIHLIDHRFAHATEPKAGRRIRGSSIRLVDDEHRRPDCLAQPRYWVARGNVDKRTPGDASWFVGFRDVTGAVTNVRTAVFSLLPRVGVGHKIPLICLQAAPQAQHVGCFLANVNSLVFDYLVRQKVSGMSLGFFILKQLPVLPPGAYSERNILLTIPRVLELVYTAWDIKPFADDVWQEADERLRTAIRRQWEQNRTVTGGHEWEPPEWAEIAEDGIPLPPFKWDEASRAVLRAELDAYYARLYGLNRKQLRYILDPADLTARELEDILDPWEEVADPLDPQGYAQRAANSDFPGETFRVLKEKEIRKYGEYRTRRLVLEAWERIAKK